MGFFEILFQVTELLQREGRITYQALKREFALDDAFLADLKAELIEAKQVAKDEHGRVLVWTGMPGSTSPHPTPSQRQDYLPHSYTPPYLAAKILTSRPVLEGERKQVTVFFADIKGSTELIAHLDPEEAGHLLDPALHLMMDAVHRYEGTVNQVLGDGIMALFGAPLAHEDHALRACYAALAAQAAMHRYAEEVRRSHGVEMRVRIGLNSGEVVVRSIGNDLHMDYSAVGQTTNLASRMEQLATPGSILLTGATLRLVEGLVRVDALGPVPIKGLANPVEVFTLVGVSTLRRRLQVAVAHGLTRFVGRQRELEMLRHALAQAEAGHGQVVAIVGEAGVGKSRLIYEFVHSPHTAGWLLLEGVSVSYGKTTAYFPLIDLLKRYAHVEDGDDLRTIRAKVTGRVLMLDEGLQDTTQPLLSLVDALPEDSAFLKLDPPQRRQRILEALKRVVLHESQVQPLLLVFEDLHWTDSETQTLLDHLVENLPKSRILILGNYRPEYQHSWGDKTSYTQLRLDPLPSASADELLQAILGDNPELEPLKQLLVECTAGNPFFLEECVRTLLETQALVGEPGAYRLARELPTIQVPATVQAVLAARIDRLPSEEKHLLHTAAVVGTEVSFPLLHAIAELPEEALYRCLAHLQSMEFLYETDLFPERRFVFKHALTHEVAYGTLLQERRRLLHARIVEALERLAGARLPEHVDRLAHHAVRGELWDKAVTYLQQAGVKAAAHSAYREAVTCWERALEALQHLVETRRTIEQAIDLRFALRNALWPLGDHRRISEHLSVAESLAAALNDQHRLGVLSSFMTQHFRLTGELDRAIAAGQRALDIATSLEDVALQAETHFRLGRAYDSLGDYRRAADFFRRNVTSLAGEQSYEHFGLPGVASVLSRSWLVLCLAELGEFTEGRARGEEAVQIAEASDHPYSLSSAYCGLGGLYLRQGDLPRAIRALERGLGLCQTWNFRVLFPTLASQLGSAYALAGRLSASMALLQQAVEQASRTEPVAYYALFLVRLSEVYLLAGRINDATELAGHASALTHEHAKGGHHAWRSRLLGEIAAQRQPPDLESAANHYQQALSLCEELGMAPLQAHCHLGLGLLYSQTGRVEQARLNLAVATELYRSMGMAFWLSQVETALAQMA